MYHVEAHYRPYAALKHKGKLSWKDRIGILAIEVVDKCGIVVEFSERIDKAPSAGEEGSNSQFRIGSKKRPEAIATVDWHAMAARARDLTNC